MRDSGQFIERPCLFLADPDTHPLVYVEPHPDENGYYMVEVVGLKSRDRFKTSGESLVVELWDRYGKYENDYDKLLLLVGPGRKSTEVYDLIMYQPHHGLTFTQEIHARSFNQARELAMKFTILSGAVPLELVHIK